VDLPRFVLSGKGYASHGRYVFHSSDGARRVALVQADVSANLGTQDQGFVLY